MTLWGHILVQWRHDERDRRLKSPMSCLFAQPFVQAQIKNTSKLGVTGLCEGPTDSHHTGQVTRIFSIWKRTHVMQNFIFCELLRLIHWDLITAFRGLTTIIEFNTIDVLSAQNSRGDGQVQCNKILVVFDEIFQWLYCQTYCYYTRIQRL